MRRGHDIQSPDRTGPVRNITECVLYDNNFEKDDQKFE